MEDYERVRNMSEEECAEEGRLNCEHSDKQTAALEPLTLPRKPRTGMDPYKHMIELSAAISLKRIADLLEQLVIMKEAGR